MFCVNCGAAVPDGAKVCEKCGHPVSVVDVSVLASLRQNIALRNIRIMNVVGAAGMAFVWGGLIYSRSNTLSIPLLAALSLIFLFAVAVPTVSLMALSSKAGRTLRRIAFGLNIAVIVIWVFALFEGVFFSPSRLIYSVPAALFYVVPQSINIWALRVMRSRAAPQE